jgi:hypothetical protein
LTTHSSRPPVGFFNTIDPQGKFGARESAVVAEKISRVEKVFVLELTELGRVEKSKTWNPFAAKLRRTDSMNRKDRSIRNIGQVEDRLASRL